MGNLIVEADPKGAWRGALPSSGVGTAVALSNHHHRRGRNIRRFSWRCIY